MKYDPIIQLEFTTRCNHDCTYCPRYLIDKTRSLGDITPEMADLLVKRLSELKDKPRLLLSVSGFGEPLLYPKLIELTCRIKAASRADIRLNTNSSLLDKLGREIIESKCVDYLTLSLNLPTRELYREYTGRPDFDKVEHNILEFLKIKGNRRPAVNIRFIKMPDTMPYLDEATKTWEKHLNKNDRVSIAELANWGGLIGELIDPQEGSCRYLSTQAGKHLSLTMEGDASICCFSVAYGCDHPLVVGNIKHNSIEELLKLAEVQSKTFDFSRVCRYCNTPRVKQS